MKALALLLALASPAAAQVQCAGLADMQAALYLSGFHAVHSGQIDGGTVTVYTHTDGRFVVMYADRETMCLVQDGTGWAAVQPDL